MSGTVTRGIVDRTLILANAQAERLSAGVGFNAVQSLRYGIVNARRTERDILTRAFLHYGAVGPWYPYAMATSEFDFKRRIEHRYQLGLGLAYRLPLDRDRHRLKATVTLLRERTRFRLEDPEAADFPEAAKRWRATLRAVGEHSFLDEAVSVEYEAWFQPALTAPENYRVLIAGTVGVRLSEWLSVTTRVDYSYESVVVPSRDKTDFLFTYGITLTNS